MKKTTKKNKKKKVELTLPTEKSTPLDNIGGYIFLIYGRKKIGKTSMCQWFKNAFFHMFEPGAKQLAVYKRNPKTWTEFKRYNDLLIKDKRFDTVIIDPPGIAYAKCLRYVCDKKLFIDHPGTQKDYGKSWGAVKEEFKSEINKLTDSGMGVVFISHQKEIKIEKRDGSEYDMLTNTMPGGAKDVIEGITDVWANYDYDGEKRILQIMGDDYVDAGHRLNEPPCPRFMYTDGTPIRIIDMGGTSKEAHDNLIKAFNNQLVKPIKKEGKKSKVVKKKKKILKLKKNK